MRKNSIEDTKKLMESFKKNQLKLLKEDMLLEQKVDRILADPRKRAVLYEHYKAQCLAEGVIPTNEGFRDRVKGWAKAAKDKVVGAADKVVSSLEGIKDIITTKGAPTLLDGEETFDKRERLAKQKQAFNILTDEIEALRAASQDPEFKGAEEAGEINTLMGDLEESGFPNNKKAGFAQGLQKIEALYDKIVANFNSGEGMSATEANVLIAVLRHVVVYFQDFVLDDRFYYYKGMLEEQEALPPGEKQDKFSGIKGKGEEEGSKNYAAAYGSKLPMGLLAVGALLSGLGVAADSDMAKNLLETFKEYDIKELQVPEGPEKIAQEFVQNIPGDANAKEVMAKFGGMKDGITVPKGYGPIRFIEYVTGADVAGSGKKASALLDPQMKPWLPALKDYFEKAKPGGGEVFERVLAGAKANPDAALGTLIKKGTESSGLPGDAANLFATKWGLPIQIPEQIKMAALDNKVVSQIMVPNVNRTIRNVILKKPKQTLANTVLAWLGANAAAVLGGLGIAFAGAAAGSAALRKKGKMSSRMADLEQLFKQLPNVKDKEQVSSDQQAPSDEVVDAEFEEPQQLPPGEDRDLPNAEIVGRGGEDQEEQPQIDDVQSGQFIGYITSKGQKRIVKVGKHKTTEDAVPIITTGGKVPKKGVGASYASKDKIVGAVDKITPEMLVPGTIVSYRTSKNITNKGTVKKVSDDGKKVIITRPTKSGKTGSFRIGIPTIFALETDKNLKQLGFDGNPQKKQLNEQINRFKKLAGIL